MKADELPSPESLHTKWKTRFTRCAPTWLVAHGDWPLSWPLHPPSEQTFRQDTARVREWALAWREWDRRHGGNAVRWVRREWARLGSQDLPDHVVCRTPAELASWIGESARWQRAKERADGILVRWPGLANVAVGHFKWLADEKEQEYARHMAVLAWVVEHPHSGIYLRQLPIPGIDTKWLEGRKGWMRKWVTALGGSGDHGGDLYDLLGLRRLPIMMEMRVGDPLLRARLGGLTHFVCPVNEAALLRCPIHSVLIVENRQSGLAIEPADGVVIVMSLGYALGSLPSIPWLAGARIGYWSDLDTHGFAMLHRLRSHFPQTESLLMDDATMLRYKELWVREPSPHPADSLANLTSEEQETYRRFKHDWKNMRLEQERIPWQHVAPSLSTWMRTIGHCSC